MHTTCHHCPVCTFFFIITDADRCSFCLPYTTLFRSGERPAAESASCRRSRASASAPRGGRNLAPGVRPSTESEEHTSELQSPCKLVCRLLLEKKNVI